MPRITRPIYGVSAKTTSGGCKYKPPQALDINMYLTRMVNIMDQLNRHNDKDLTLTRLSMLENEIVAVIPAKTT
jgi:hypothetical protein